MTASPHRFLERTLDLAGLLKKKSHFLLGPRQTGKTSLVNHQLPKTRVYNLLDTSLYLALAQRVIDSEVLQILLSIGPTETAHFQIWHDKAGNAPSLKDPTNPSLVFPDLNALPFGGENFQTNLVMPEPCPFISRNLTPNAGLPAGLTLDQFGRILRTGEGGRQISAKHAVV